MLALLRPSGVPRHPGPRGVFLVVATSLGLGACYQGLDDADRGPTTGALTVTAGEADDGAVDDGTDGGDGGAETSGGDGGGETGGPSDDSGGGDSTTGDPTTAGSADDGGDSGGQTDEVPDNAYCAGVKDWQPNWSQMEQEVLDLVNQYRAQGANCGSAGSFGATHPLTMNPYLRCAARVHSKDMNDRGFFDHVNPSGEDPFDRIQQTGYSMRNGGENIAGGSPDAAGTMSQWMGSDGHCSNIMNPDYQEIGVGYYPGGQWGHLWTQAFGTPG